LKVSFARMPSIAFATTAFDFSSGKPLIDPDVSSTKTSSRGRTSSSTIRAGGASTMVRYPAETPATSDPAGKTSAFAATWVKTLSVIASSWSRQRSTKSRFGIVSRRARDTSTRPTPSGRSTISCNGASIDAIGTPPVSRRTSIEMSWPALVPGRTGIGVIRLASGT
jgi:hypothetical protein